MKNLFPDSTFFTGPHTSNYEILGENLKVGSVFCEISLYLQLFDFFLIAFFTFFSLNF